jgi:hypothetical protein
MNTPPRRCAPSPPKGDHACGPARPVPRRALVEGISVLFALPVALFVGITPLLFGCSASNQGNEWFPLRVGDAQTYQVSYNTDEPHDTDTWTLTTLGPEIVDGQALMQRHHSDGVTYYFKVGEEGIRRIATRMDIDQEPTMETEPRWVIKAPYQVGTEWSTPTVPYLIQHRNEYPRQLKYTHRAIMSWHIEALDDEVRTSSGTTYKPCMRVVGTARLNLYTDPVKGFTDVPLISREWYCKGQGLVKFEREERVPAGFFTGGALTAVLEP